MELALTVLGRDRPGVGAEVLGALVEGGAAIRAARGGSVAGRFSFMVVVDVESEQALLWALDQTARRLELELMVTRAGGEFLRGGANERAVLSCYGPVEPEAMVQLFRVLGRFNVNVEDFRFDRLEGRGSPRLRADLEVRVPATVALDVLVEALRELEEETGLESTLRSDLSFLV